MRGAAIVLTFGVLVASCGSDAHLPASLDDPRTLPPLMREHGREFCAAALEAMRPIRPELVSRVGALADDPYGNYPSSNQVICNYSDPEQAALITFEPRCADPTDAACIVPLALAVGREGWSDPSYVPAMGASSVTVERLILPNETD